MTHRIVQQHYPGAVEEGDFVTHTASLLLPIGFNRDNSLPIVAICRDEICSSFISTVEQEWGPSFNLGGLAGIPFAGKTGMSAASHHAPDGHERERFIIYGMAHIGFGPHGEVGACLRPGMQHINSACGALIGYTKQLAENSDEVRQISTDDPEFGLLKMRLNPIVPAGKPDLITVTSAALNVIKQDIISLSKAVLDVEHHDYAVFLGTVLHLPESNMVHLSESWVVMDGKFQQLTVLPDLAAAE